MNRAYSVKQHANTGKRSAVVETVRAYRKTAEKMQDRMMNLAFNLTTILWW